MVCCHVRAPPSVSPQSLLDGTVSGFSGCPHPLLVPWRGSPPAKLMITPGSASTLQLPLDLTLVFSRNVSRPCPLPWLILPLAFWGWRRASSGYTGQGPAPPQVIRVLPPKVILGPSGGHRCEPDGYMPTQEGFLEEVMLE